MYGGENLAKKGVVFVNFNYRVGALGFLAHPELTAESPHHASGDYGFLDQIAALQWIKRNIAEVRRRSRQRHDLRPIGRRGVGVGAGGEPSRQRLVPARRSR